MLEHYKKHLNKAHIEAICSTLDQSQETILSLRKCTLTDKDYKKLLQAIGRSSSIRQLCLCVGLLSDKYRLEILTTALKTNRSIQALFLHGNPIGEAGIKLLYPALREHPRLTSLDVSDCRIGDEGLELLCSLLPNRPSRLGLLELTLSGNPDITSRGWLQLGMAVAGGSSLRGLYLDYNDIGDNSLAALLVALTAARTLETLDLECIGVTDSTAQTLLHLLETYPVNFKTINLTENDVSPHLMEAIQRHLTDTPNDSKTPTNHDTASDDERSLATSEPPLNSVQIVGASDSPTDGSRDTLGSERNGGFTPESQIVKGGSDFGQYPETTQEVNMDTKISNMTDEDVLIFAKGLESQESDNFLSTNDTSRRPSLVMSESGSVTTIEVVSKESEPRDHNDVNNGTDLTLIPAQMTSGHSNSQHMSVQSASVLTAWEGCQSRTSIHSDTELINRKRTKPKKRDATPKTTLADLIKAKNTNNSQRDTTISNTTPSSSFSTIPNDLAKTLGETAENQSVTRIAAFDETEENDRFTQQTRSGHFDGTRRSSVKIQDDVEIEDIL